MTSELADLIQDTEDAIMFLRSQMLNGANPQDGADQTDTWREETGREVTTGDKPKSKPPMNLGAMDAADAEMAVLVAWAEHVGIPYTGQVWRVNGIPQGVLYGDMRPVRSLAANICGLLRDGWVAPDGMLEGVRAVRDANLRVWPELDVYLERPVEERVVDDGQESLW
ncbi:hypothetical protein ACH47B_13185 [Rhodococcus sp. NPDC019627]|uniref:hypothetical protein n=1 Tax=unclassified Rhodococcus (in: high G+C Gram-positive bacteria) TaxID=192944 RepID=UPI0033C91568